MTSWLPLPWECSQAVTGMGAWESAEPLQNGQGWDPTYDSICELISLRAVVLKLWVAIPLGGRRIPEQGSHIRYAAYHIFAL